MKYVLAIMLFGLIPLRASAFTTAELADDINQVRIDNRIGFLNWSPALASIAQSRAEYLLKTQTISHEGWTQFYKGKGVCGYGENLAVYFPDSDSTVKGWMNSPTHKANILERRYTLTGLAVVPGKFQGQQTFMVVQTFGRRC